MTGEEKFLALGVIISQEKIDLDISASDVRSKWSKGLLGKYNPGYYYRAESKGWVIPDDAEHNKFIVTPEGFKHLKTTIGHEEKDELLNPKEVRKTGKLFIFNKSSAYSFDKFIRNILKNAKSRVLIADSYVDETIFDNHLETLPNDLIIKVLFMNDSGSFGARMKRFKVQFKKSDFKKYKDLHDRFIIVDDIAYIIGPSIKDAAANSPAIVVGLNQQETLLISNFFSDIWKLGK